MSGSNSKYQTPTKSGKRRECDSKGCGHYGASRGTTLVNGVLQKRLHKGIDFVTQQNEPILAPFSGKVTRHPFAASDMLHKGIEIVNGKENHQLFYLIPTVAIGSMVKKGQIIGYAQNIQGKYGPQMTNHVHHEVKINGVFINPTNLYNI